MKSYFAVIIGSFLGALVGNASTSELKIGELYCPELKVTDQVPSEITSCPLLIAGFTHVSGKPMLHVIDSRSQHFNIPAPAAKEGSSTWTTNFSGTLKGVLDSTISIMVGARQPGISRPVTIAALRIAEKNTEDTVPLSNLISSPKSGAPAATASTCLDTLASHPFYGLVNGSFLPGRLCEFALSRYYQVAANGSVSLKNSPHTVTIIGLYAAAKHFSVKGRKPDWIWADFSTTQGSLWLLRQAGRPDVALSFGSSEVSEANSVRVEDLDGDGIQEFLFTLDHHYGDGEYQTLCLIKTAKNGKPTVWQSGIGGSSGESGGSTVVADWWISSLPKQKSKRLYIATAQVANENGEAVTGHDLQIQAYTLASKVSLVKGKRFSVALFGTPESRNQAEATARVIGKLPHKATTPEIRILPRWTNSGLQWQVGALAPDAKTARAWAGVEKTGTVFRTH